MSGRADAVSGTAGRVTPAVGGNSSVGPAFSKSADYPGKRQSYLELVAILSAVPSARLHARFVVAEWGLGALAEDVELIVSELVTNAVQASEGLVGSRWRGQWAPVPPPIRLWLQADHEHILIQVWDGSDRMPHREMPASDTENGRGLLLVETFCQRYGAYPLEGCSGKVVWGEVAGS